MTDEKAMTQSGEALDALAVRIENAVSVARQKLAGSVNSIMVETYWQVGRHIVEYEQGGHAYAQYGRATLSELSKRLRLRLDKGFSRPNLTNMRKFYLLYPICQTVSEKLGWSHISEK